MYRQTPLDICSRIIFVYSSLNGDGPAIGLEIGRGNYLYQREEVCFECGYFSFL